MECHNYATRGRKLFESLILNDSEKALNSSKVQANVPSTSCTEKQRRVCFGGVSLHRFGIVPGACTVPDDGGVTSMALGDEFGRSDYPSLEEFEIDSRIENQTKRDRWDDKFRKQIILDENNNQKTNKKGKKNRRKRKKQTPKYCEDSSSEDSDNFLYGAGESCRFQITEPVRKIALMENVSPDKLQDCEQLEFETRTILESRISVGCNCAGGNCLPETCECALNGIQCQFDCKESRKNRPCACGPKKCSNTNGIRIHDPNRVYAHFVNTLQRIKDAAQMGVEYASPTRIEFSGATNYLSTPAKRIKKQLKISSPLQTNKLLTRNQRKRVPEDVVNIDTEPKPTEDVVCT